MRIAGRREEDFEINVISLIDVLLTLLMFFVLTTTFVQNSRMQVTLPQAQSQFDAGDYTASLQTLAALRVPVDAYFDGVMVNAEALDVRLNRLGTLKSLHDAMNRVADLARIAS